MSPSTAPRPDARRFIVTTSRSVLLLDVDSRRFDTIHSGSGLYYGIDVGADDVLVAARGRMVSSTVPHEEERGVVLRFDNELQIADTIAAPFPLRDLHQIRRVGERLFLTCSFDNFIAIHDGRTWEQWMPLGRPEAPPWDVNHYNTIEVVDGRLAVVAHNKGESEVLLFDPRTRALEARVRLGVQSHNVWTHDGELHTCSSGEGRLRGTRGFDVLTGGFPRGVAIEPGFALVGISQVAERQDRDFTTSSLLVFDTEWRETDRFELPQQGLLLDVVAWNPARRDRVIP